MHVLIAGCGYVGSALGQQLHAAGHRVWGLARTPDRLPSGIEPVVADLTDPASLTDLPPALDAVVYAASADGFSESAYQAAYVDGPRHLLARLVQDGQRPKRLLFTSSTGVYGQSDGAWVDEASPADNDHFSGAVLRQGEALFLDGPFPATIARLGGIYGPGRTRLIDRVRSGEATCAEGEERFTNRIHRQDAAGALGHLVSLDDPSAVYLVVDREPAERCQVLRWIAEQLEVAPPEVLADGGTRRGQRSNKRVSSRRLVESGYTHRYPSFREGYGEMIRSAG